LSQIIAIKEPSILPLKSPAQQSNYTPSVSHIKSSWCHHWKPPASLHWIALSCWCPRVWVSPLWSPRLSALRSTTNCSQCHWGMLWMFVTDVATVAWKQQCDSRGVAMMERQHKKTWKLVAVKHRNVAGRFRPNKSVWAALGGKWCFFPLC
jgi:hypothetical protein